MALQGTLSSAISGLGESYALSPSAARAETIDRELRARLIDSFSHIAECADLGRDGTANLECVKAELHKSSVSPWVFCLYSKLVAELSRNNGHGARSAVSDIAASISLSSEARVVPFRDRSIAAMWWDHLEVLFDTDSERQFNPQVANPETFALCEREVGEGLSLLRLADQPWHDELRILLRMIVVGSAPLDGDDLFNGTSTFFFWGGILINAEARRSAVSIVDLLVHESSHLLLFGLSGDGPLLNNKGEERYSSPLRADPRPIDGLLHACFVASRVHLAMCRLLDSGCLTAANAKRASDRRDQNEKSARIALDILNHNARPTERGESVLASLRSYWAATSN